MALNWTMLNPNRTPVPLPRELTILTIDSGAEVSIDIPNKPPEGSATAGGSGGAKKLKESGKVFLTDQRLIFTADGASAAFDSLSIPLHSILATKFEQPYLGANYLAVDVKPSPDGGLTDGTKAEFRLKNQGLFQFVSLLEKTRERALYMRRQVRDEEETLPAYASPAATSTRAAGTPTEAPPGYDA
ncbi:hypothetical protein FA95DRAFT_1561455 [Auriscalpium vulgare]|uniref:Uncharacterized protein n=1 Tax=Auriscalpium vulgare TaxID=40419 RepID=A0ACB8RNM6_9AGAM|nr:hypothetical protein FA95DRAFT_1561455 [Auriscalpium vulgare]